MKRLKGKGNICEAVGASISPYSSAIAMPIYDCDLFQYAFEDNNKLRVNEVRRVFKQICVGVFNMHSAGVAHMDLKPENILFKRESKSVAICDFGFSCITDDKQKKIRVPFTSCGTVEYQAPEVTKSYTLNPFPADIYSLGCILYVLLVGCFPAFREYDGELYIPSSMDLPRNSADFLLQTLAYDPAARPTIQQVLEHPFLQDSQPLGAFARFWKRSFDKIKKI